MGISFKEVTMMFLIKKTKPKACETCSNLLSQEKWLWQLFDKEQLIVSSVTLYSTKQTARRGLKRFIKKIQKEELTEKR